MMAGSARARAQTASARACEAVPSRRQVVALSVGLGSALGFGGVSYGYATKDWLLLEGGVGYGVTGVQVSTMVKLTLGSERQRFVTGVGTSVGLAPDYAWSQATGPTLWLNVDAVGGEYRFSNGVSLGGAFGVAVGLAGGGHFYSSDVCLALHCNRGSGEHWDEVAWAGTVFPQARAQVGYWF
jgi:hypothetical protein